MYNFYQNVLIHNNYYNLVTQSDSLKKFCEQILDNTKILKNKLEHVEEEIKKEKL